MSAQQAEIAATQHQLLQHSGWLKPPSRGWTDLGGLRAPIRLANEPDLAVL